MQKGYGGKLIFLLSYSWRTYGPSMMLPYVLEASWGTFVTAAVDNSLLMHEKCGHSMVNGFILKRKG